MSACLRRCGKLCSMGRPRHNRSGRARGLHIPWQQVAIFRAHRHRLQRRAPRGAMLSVVREICGLHAQVLSSAELSLWARVEELAPAAVERALWTKGSLVKTWAMRGTLHLLPRRELPLFFGALSTYTHFLRQAWVKHFGVTGEELDEIVTAVAQTLPGVVLTREELAMEIARRTGLSKHAAVLRQSWGVMLKPAAFRGQLCFAQSEGQRVRFTHPGVVGIWGGAEALRELARRYLAAYGPATRQDFAAWWGESAKDTEILLDSLDTVAVEVDGARAFLLERDARALLSLNPTGAVRLLPAFDPYVIGAPRRGGLFPIEQKPRIFRGQGWISATLLVDGRIEGVWRQDRRGGKLTLTVETFARPSASVRSGVSVEAERLAVFVGCTLQKLSWAR
jgi:hypothetical protein